MYYCQDHSKFTALYLLHFWKDFDLERSSSLINELVIRSLLCISGELSQLSLTAVSKQLKSPVAVANVFKSESLPTTMSYLTEAEQSLNKLG